MATSSGQTLTVFRDMMDKEHEIATSWALSLINFAHKCWHRVLMISYFSLLIHYKNQKIKDRRHFYSLYERDLKIK